MSSIKSMPLPEINLDDLDLLTEDEKKFNNIHITKLIDFASEKGKTTAMELKSLTPGAAVIAKRQQSRSATLMAKLTIMGRYGDESEIKKLLKKTNG